MELRIALAGNPNSGKTTLFNSLTGSNQFVGNWAGVTVEKKEGKLKKAQRRDPYGSSRYLLPFSLHAGGSGGEKLPDRRSARMRS